MSTSQEKNVDDTIDKFPSCSSGTTTIPIPVTSNEKTALQQQEQHCFSTVQQHDEARINSLRLLLCHVTSFSDIDIEGSKILRTLIERSWHNNNIETCSPFLPNISTTVNENNHDLLDKIVTNEDVLSLFNKSHKKSSLDNLRWKCMLLGHDEISFDEAYGLLSETYHCALKYGRQQSEQFLFQMETRLYQERNTYWLVRRFLDALVHVNDFKTPWIRPLTQVFAKNDVDEEDDVEEIDEITIDGRIGPPVIQMLSISSSSSFIGLIASNWEISMIQSIDNKTVPIIQVLKCSTRKLQHIALNELKNRLVGCFTDGLCVVWDITDIDNEKNTKKPKVINTVVLSSSKTNDDYDIDILDCCFDCDGKTLYILTRHYNHEQMKKIVVSIWDISKFGQHEEISETVIKCDGSLIQMAKFIHNGKSIATGDKHNVIGIADSMTGDYKTNLMNLGFKNGDGIKHLMVSNKNECMVWYGDTNVVITDMQGMNLRRRMASSSSSNMEMDMMECMTLSENGLLGMVTKEGMLKIWDLKLERNKKHNDVILLHECRIKLNTTPARLCLKEDKEIYCVVCGFDGSTHLIRFRKRRYRNKEEEDDDEYDDEQLQHGVKFRKLKHKSKVACVTLMDDEMKGTRMMVSGGEDGSIIAWKISVNTVHNNDDGVIDIQKDVHRGGVKHIIAWELNMIISYGKYDNSAVTWVLNEEHGLSFVQRVHVDGNAMKMEEIEEGSTKIKEEVNNCDVEQKDVMSKQHAKVKAKVRCTGRHVVDRQNGKVLATLPAKIVSDCAWCVSDDGRLLVVGMSNGDVVWFTIEA